jgi:hypothetical protein
MRVLVLGETTNPVARRDHRCQLCSREIQSGERYNRQRNIGDDGPYVFKACAHCTAMVKVLNEIEGDWYDDWEGYSYTDLLEFDPSAIYTARLRVMFRRGWRRRDGSLYPVPGAGL